MELELKERIYSRKKVYKTGLNKEVKNPLVFTQRHFETEDKKNCIEMH